MPENSYFSQLNRIAEALHDDPTPEGNRRYLLFMSGIYLGRRISDMLPLRVGDVLGKDKFVIQEKKTGKKIELWIVEKLKRAYKERLSGRDPDEYVFASSRADRITGKQKPIDRRTAYRDIQYIKRLARLPESYKLGTHTLRKTFGYHYYKKTNDIAGLMKLFNHSKEEVTLIYIGINSDEIRQTFRRIPRSPSGQRIRRRRLPRQRRLRKRFPYGRRRFYPRRRRRQTLMIQQ